MVKELYLRRHPQVGDIWVANTRLRLEVQAGDKLIVSRIMNLSNSERIVYYITIDGNSFSEVYSIFRMYCRPVDEPTHPWLD